MDWGRPLQNHSYISSPSVVVVVVFLALMPEQPTLVGAYAVCPCMMCRELMLRAPIILGRRQAMSDVRASMSALVVIQYHQVDFSFGYWILMGVEPPWENCLFSLF